MDIEEYEKVRGMTYSEYCNYLQIKYGISSTDYMTKSFSRNPKWCSRTKDGLVSHHKREDSGIMLSTPQYAKMYPYEWQQKENIVYCDYLEHLLLHTLICKYPQNNNPHVLVGVGGIVNFIVPELNDAYSGYVPSQRWRYNCYKKVIDDKNVYFAILEQFIKIMDEFYSYFDVSYLCKSRNIGVWDASKNRAIYDEIISIYKTSYSQQQ